VWRRDRAEARTRPRPGGGILSGSGPVYASMTARADELFELTEAVLCTEGPVRTLAIVLAGLRSQLLNSSAPTTRNPSHAGSVV